MNSDITYLSQKLVKITDYQIFGVSTVKKGGGAAPKRHPIGLKFFWESFFGDVIPKSLTEHKLSKLLFFWDTLTLTGLIELL